MLATAMCVHLLQELLLNMSCYSQNVCTFVRGPAPLSALELKGIYVLTSRVSGTRHVSSWPRLTTGGPSSLSLSNVIKGFAS